jgi:hypothetical protein
MSPLDLGPDLDIILGWDLISSHDLRFLYPQGRVTGTGSHGPLSAPLRRASPASAQASVLISHGEFRCMLRRVVPAWSDGPAGFPANVAHMATPPPRRHGGMSKPLDPLGTTALTEAERLHTLRRALRRTGMAPPSRVPSFVEDSRAPSCWTTARCSTSPR